MCPVLNLELLSYGVLYLTYLKELLNQDLRKKPGFYSKSLFLTHKYLRETGFLSLPA